jgi:hypothetical protein
VENKREVYSSIFGFTSDVTLVSYIPARKKTAILLSQQHDNTYMDEEKDFKPEILMHTVPAKVGLMFWTSS